MRTVGGGVAKRTAAVGVGVLWRRFRARLKSSVQGAASAARQPSRSVPAAVVSAGYSLGGMGEKGPPGPEASSVDSAVGRKQTVPVWLTAIHVWGRHISVWSLVSIKRVGRRQPTLGLVRRELCYSARLKMCLAEQQKALGTGLGWPRAWG